MTKRFIQSRHYCIDRNEKRKTTEWDIVIEWLNQLEEENEQLKHDANVLIEANMKYRKENGELREAMKRMMIDMMDGE